MSTEEKRPTESFAIKELDILASMIDRLNGLADGKLSEQYISEIITAAELIAKIPPLLDHLAESTQSQIGPKTSALKVENSYRNWRRQIGRLAELCRGIGDHTTTLKHLVSETGESISSLQCMLNQCRSAEQEQLAQANLQGDLQEIDGILANGMLACWRPGWDRVKEEARRVIETDGRSASAQKVLEHFTSTWEFSIQAGRDLAKVYGCLEDWPVRARLPEESPSAWLLVVLRSTEIWGKRQLARMLTLRPAELPLGPLDLEPRMTAPVAQLAFELEMRLASLRARAIGSGTTIERLARLFEQTRSGDYIPEAEVYICLVQLLADCEFNTDYLTALEKIAVILGEGQAVKCCREAVNRVVGTMPSYLRVPRFSPTDTSTLGYHIMRKAVQDNSVDLAFGFRVWALQPDWRSVDWETSQDSMWQRLRELDPVGWWVTASILDKNDSAERGGANLFMEHATKAGASCTLMLPLIKMQSVNLSDDRVLAILTSLELVAIHNQCGVSLRGLPLFVQRFGRQYPVLCARLRTEMTKHDPAPGGIGAMSGPGSAVEEDIDRKTSHAVRPRHYRGIKCLERLSGCFVKEHAAPLLARLKAAENDESIRRLITTAEEMDVERLIAQWERAFIHGPEGQLRQHLVDDCIAMLTAIRAFGEDRLRHPEAFAAEQQTLNRELQSLRRLGELPSRATDLMVQILSGEGVAMTVPGASLCNVTDLNVFPRLLATWRSGCLELESYEKRFEADLLEDARDYAGSEAKSGRVSWATQIMDNAGVPATDEKRQRMEEDARYWSELVDSDRRDVLDDLESEAEVDEVRETLSGLTDALARRNYDDAVNLLDSLRPRAAASRKRKQEAKQNRDELVRDVEKLLLDASRAKLSLENKTQWTQRVLVLQEKVTMGTDLSAIRAELSMLATRLSEGEALPPPRTNADIACSFSSESREEQCVPAGQQQRAFCCGIVKAVVGGTYGFILPFEKQLRDGEDIYFHKNNLRGETGIAVEMPQPGCLVGFRGIISRRDQPRPNASEVWSMSKAERTAAIAELSSDLGMSLNGVGFISRRILFTVGHGFHTASKSGAYEDEKLVAFHPSSDGRPEEDVSPIESPSRVTAETAAFFRRLTGRTMSPIRLPSSEGQVLSPAEVQFMDSTRPNSYRDAKAFQLRLEETREHQRVVDTIEDLNMRSANSGQIAWLRAVFIGSFLSIAKDNHEPVQTLLQSLAKDSQRWFGQNEDATFSLVYHGLHVFADNNPQELSHHDVYGCFLDIQSSLGERPHYRLELIMAAIAMEEAEQNIQDEEKIERAATHIRRAMVIHPRLTEPRDMLRQLSQRFGTGWQRSVLSQTVTSEPILPTPPVPTDPIDATEKIRNFYDSLRGRSDEMKAERFFNNWRERVPLGMAREELLARHCRYLLTLGGKDNTRAEELILDEARKGNVNDWSMVVDILYDVWRALDLEVSRGRSLVARLEATLPAAAKPHMDFLLANLLFDGGHYDSALVHAEQAQEVLRSVDARELANRCKQMASTRDRTATPEQTRENAWSDVQRFSAEGDSHAVVELVTNCMKDAHVGPWLVWKCVSESGIVNQEIERRELIRRARSFEKDGPASIELLKADICVKWDVSIAQQVEQLDEGILLEAARKPTSAVLAKIDDVLRDATAAFALYDSLLQAHPSSLDISWHLAMAAKRLLARNGERKYAEEYVQASLPCVGAMIQNCTSAIIANDMLSMRLFGLAAIIAHTGTQNGQNNQKGITDIVTLALEKALPAPWEWPSVLQKSRIALDEGRWGDAANLIVCALLANPSHWPTCRSYLRVFTYPNGETQTMLRAALHTALSGIQLSLATQRGKESPELLVLKAELVLAEGELEGTQEASDKAAQECDVLCTGAQRLRQGFKPAILLQNRLKRDDVLAPGSTYAKRYRIVEALPSGSYGQVYRAEVLDPQPGELHDVALKFVRADSSTPERKKRQGAALTHEAKIALRLKHPAIVNVLDFLDNRCLVMEYIDGATLASKIDHHIREPWHVAHQIGIQVASALEYATLLVRREFRTYDDHSTSHEFAHRDIHPRNIMVVMKDGPIQAKLLDFGLASGPGGTGTTALLQDANKKLPYRPPEYGSKMDHRADMFALGVVLYELITGEGPYPHPCYCDFQNGVETGDVTALTLRRIGELLGPNSDVPERFADVLAKMVAFKCVDRYDDWTSLLKDIREVPPPAGRGPI
ncbi:MAG: protein kinase [bacterium]